MRSLLDFDDAGAGDDEPAKGVTVGDIRAWHDTAQDLLNALAEVTTNGKWTDGEQRGDWQISQAVYETARDAIYKATVSD